MVVGYVINKSPFSSFSTVTSLLTTGIAAKAFVLVGILFVLDLLNMSKMIYDGGQCRFKVLTFAFRPYGQYPVNLF